MSAQAERQRRTGEASRTQRSASHPERSVWVAAAAGTGKTRVLIDRVLRLLLAGAAPERLLAITFTRAAAAEMSKRLAERLRHWATCSDKELVTALEGLLDRWPEENERTLARRLFARVLDTPGGLQILTIHAYCQSLLRRFPLETGIAPNFTLLEEREAAELLAEQRDRVLAGAEGPLAEAVARVSAETDEGTLAGLLDSLLRERERLRRLRARLAGPEALRREVWRSAGLDPEERVEPLLAAACAEAAFDGPALRELCQVMAEGSEPERKKAATMGAWLAARPDLRRSHFEDYRKTYFTSAGEPLKRFANKATMARLPNAEEVIAAETERLQALTQRLKALQLAEASAALLQVALAVLAGFDRAKQRRALLDYDDLILAAKRLLSQQGRAAWVLFKLDGGIDHLLIDEAQDTSPEQWAVIEALTQEFFVGEGAYEDKDRSLDRTLFVVGDVKQSIYRFQRADPQSFVSMRETFSQRVIAAERAWDSVPLSHSFRSVDAVLGLVDAVFQEPGVHRGVALDGDWIAHEAVRVGQAGRVELWPLALKERDAEEEPWTPPLTRRGAEPADIRLAETIAARIAGWLAAEPGGEGHEAWLSSVARPVRAEDILILVQSRKRFFEAMIRALKSRRIPVAGADRMVLTEQLAVMDLIAFGEVMLLPEDDLTLATVLRSPLIGFSEEALFALAYDRAGTLWEALRNRRDERDDFAAAYDFLSQWMARADFGSSYAFYAELLASGARRDLLARLGEDAADPLDEFLSAALLYEQQHAPSLQGFLHWLQSRTTTIKRDMEVESRGVRVMTVHGAKGLEAAVVFLPDAARAASSKAPRLLWPSAEGAPLWLPRKALAALAAEDALLVENAAAEAEYRRLLYVALTRARDRLYLCGWNNRGAVPEGSWYDLTRQAMRRLPEARPLEAPHLTGAGWGEDGLSLQGVQSAEPEHEGEAQRRAVGAEELVPPPCLRAPAPAEAQPPRPLAPSRGEEEPPALSPLDEAGTGPLRGRLIHRLLQSLPALPTEACQAAAERLLANPVHGLDAETAASWAAEALAVLEAPETAALFGPEGRAEVAVSGLVETRSGPQVVSGQIDRLVILSDKVLILDFKTNRPPPEQAERVPPAYLRQLALYRAVIRQIYPSLPVECLLLWTHGPRIMPIAQDWLDRHFP